MKYEIDIPNAIKEDEPYKRWRGKYGENYYYITNNGYVDKLMEEGKELDDRHYKFGNYYKTEEDAGSALERQKIENELELYSIKNSSEINREKGFYVVACILDEGADQIKPIHLYNTIDPFTFATLEDAEAAIEAVGVDRLMKYYFKNGGNENEVHN